MTWRDSSFDREQAEQWLSVAPVRALIELTEAELERLDLREMRYRRVEVAASIESGITFDAVFAYVARPEHHRPQAPPDSIIVATYPQTVEAAFDALGPGELDLYRKTTDPPGAEVVAAKLVRDRIPPGNPRAW